MKPVIALVLLLTALTGWARAAETPAPFALHELAPGVWAAIDGPQGRSGSNAGFIIGDDGVLVIDSFFDPDATRALVGEIHRLTPKPIRWVVNTHYHLDHVGGDAVLQAEGATIIAHRNVRAWIRGENPHLFGERLSPARKAQIEALPLPQLVIDGDMTLWLGGRRVEIRTVAGHTGGDLVVSAPDAHVLFCGDLLWRRVSPNLIDGTVSKWILSLNSFRASPDAAVTAFVPGHGEVANLADVAEFEAYLADLRDLVARKRAAGLSGPALVQAGLPDFAKVHGDWTAFSYFAPLELRFEDEEQAGAKRIPSAGVQ